MGTMNHVRAARARAIHQRQPDPRALRRARIAELWRMGWSLAEIGRNVDLEPKAVSAIIATMRKGGVDLRHRDTHGNWI